MPTLSPAQFDARMRDLANRRFPDVIKDIHAQVSERAYRNLVEITPVLTGFARGGWVPSINVPSTDNPNNQSLVGETGAPVTIRELAAVRLVLTVLRGLPLGQVLHLSNNRPYIGLLDAGRSPKAPAGISNPAVNATLEGIRSLRIEL